MKKQIDKLNKYKHAIFKEADFKKLTDLWFTKARNLKVYVWSYGRVSLSYNLDKPNNPYFVLSNANRKRLIKLLTLNNDKKKIWTASNNATAEDLTDLKEVISKKFKQNDKNK